ncbi:MAG: hypothetical protein U0263_01485 [Polyangiaceae bacterium]
MQLSKSKFISGLQCDKRLWLSGHEKDAPECRHRRRRDPISPVSPKTSDPFGGTRTHEPSASAEASYPGWILPG